MTTDKPVFISVDIETTGPSPATGEMCSIGAVAYDFEACKGQDELLWGLNGSFSVNLDWRHAEPLLDPDTVTWWKQFPEQWDIHRYRTVPAKTAMMDFAYWLEEISTKPIFVAWPVAFDWGFVNYYFHKYLGHNPFGYSPVCLKNFALGRLNKPYALLGHREEAEMPESWLIKPEDHGLVKHVSLDDAIAQTYMLHNILNAE